MTNTASRLANIIEPVGMRVSRIAEMQATPCALPALGSKEHAGSFKFRKRSRIAVHVGVTHETRREIDDGARRRDIGPVGPCKRRSRLHNRNPAQNREKIAKTSSGEVSLLNRSRFHTVCFTYECA